MSLLRSATCLPLILGSLLGFLPLAAGAEKPNVIVIITDDQGYGDFSCHGNPVLKTPNLDRLYSESVRFTDFHVAPMCSPTRGQLLTGMDAMRNGCTAVCQGRSMIRNDVTLMPEYFQKGGYTTGHFGKWHLGDSYPHRPHDRGFRTSLHHRAWGLTSLADHWENRTDAYYDPILSLNGKESEYPGYCTDIFFSEAMRWMKKQEQPFFLYLATNTPHVPDISPEEFSKPYREIGEYKGKQVPDQFYGMVANIDANIGRLEAFLKAEGLRDDTVLIYLSDNGTQSKEAMQIYNAGMRMKKTSVFDGGHRVPLFVRWPNGGLIEPSSIGELTQVQDLLPTLADFCDLDVQQQPLDGSSLAPLLRGQINTLPDRKLVVQYRDSGAAWDPAVVLTKRWRLIAGKQLFDIKKDPSQKNNVASKFPEVVSRLSKHYENWHSEVTPIFKTPRWIVIGTDTQPADILYAQDWDGGYCDNPKGLEEATAVGTWKVKVARAGTYEFQLRRWPEESGKTLTEGWGDSPGAPGRSNSARPIARASIEIAGVKDEKETAKGDSFASFTLTLPEGETELETTFSDASGKTLCSAIYTHVRWVEETPAN